MVLLGLIVYFWHSTRMLFVFDAFLLLLTIFVAEEQGTVDIQFPSYVARRDQTEPEICEAEAEKQGSV